MAIKIIFGPGGSGKSRFQVGDVIIPKLLYTRQNVLTNMPLELPRLQEYLEETYPNESIDVNERLRILTAAETREFWKYRGPLKAKIVEPNDENGFVYSAITYEEDKGGYGVCYVIDEAGAAGFDAQGWAASDGNSPRGVQCKWYLDQQRKFGDDVFASTNGRSPSGIAKGFRDKAHAFIKLKNDSLAVWGPFRGTEKFKWREYLTELNAASGTDPIRWGEFKLDPKGIASCYRTQEGVGVIGTKADIGVRPKGISIRWVIPMAAALAASVALVPWALGKLASRKIAGPPKVVSQSVERKWQDKHPVKEAETKPKESEAERVDKQVVRPAEPVWVRGVAIKGNHINAVLSDGRVLTERNGLKLDGTIDTDRKERIIRAERNFIDLADGQRLFVGKSTQGVTAKTDDEKKIIQ